MRAAKVTGGLVLSAAMAAAMPALAQSGQPTELDYICKLAPEGCVSADAPSDAKDRDGQRSFSLTRTAVTKPQAVQAPAQPRGRVGQGARTSYTAPSVQPAYAPGRARRPALGVSSGDMMMTFVNGSAELSPQARINAAKLASVMNVQLAGKRFLVEGHTNAVGAADSNYKLSQQRADALVAYLVAQGVDGKRLESKGYGFDRTLPGLSKVAPENRRVEAKAIS